MAGVSILGRLCTIGSPILFGGRPSHDFELAPRLCSSRTIGSPRDLHFTYHKGCTDLIVLLVTTCLLRWASLEEFRATHMKTPLSDGSPLWDRSEEAEVG